LGAPGGEGGLTAPAGSEAPTDPNAALGPDPAVGPLGTTGFAADLFLLAGAGLALGGVLVQRRAGKRRPA
jgi:hypothetical protein